MYPKQLQGAYQTSVPNEPISLFSGELKLDWNNGSVVGDGSIGLDWSPTPHIRFQMKFRPGYEAIPAPSHDDDSLTLYSSEGKGKVFRFNQVSGSSHSQRTIAGELAPTFEVGNPAPVGSLLFHVPNFPDYVGNNVSVAAGVSASRLNVETRDWIVDLDDTASTDLRTQLSEQGGFALTQVGSVRRRDGKPIQYSQVGKLLDDLLWWLSILRSERTGPALISGIDQGAPVWERWEVRLVSPWFGRKTWLPRLPPSGGWPAGPNPTSSILEFLFDLPKTPKSTNSIEQVIDWYTQAVSNTHIATIGVLAQAGTELLSWMQLVEDAGVTTKGFERMTAADQLRMALSFTKLSTDVPVSLSKLFAATRNGPGGEQLDGPGSVAEIRNSVVHPRRNTRFDDPLTMLDGNFLAIRYLELLLLHRCNYLGQALNRTAWNEKESAVSWLA